VHNDDKAQHDEGMQHNNHTIAIESSTEDQNKNNSCKSNEAAATNKETITIESSTKAIPNSQLIVNSEMQMTGEDSLQKKLVEEDAHLPSRQYVLETTSFKRNKV